MLNRGRNEGSGGSVGQHVSRFMAVLMQAFLKQKVGRVVEFVLEDIWSPILSVCAHT